MTKTDKPVRISTSVFSIVLMRPSRPITHANELDCLIGMKRKGHHASHWVLPGGGANRDVPLEQEFLREAKEETRLDIMPIWPELFVHCRQPDEEGKGAPVKLFAIFTQTDPDFRWGSLNFTDELNGLNYRSLGHICGPLRRSWGLPDIYQQAIDYFMRNGAFEHLVKQPQWEYHPLDIPQLPDFAYTAYNRPKKPEKTEEEMLAQAKTACA